MKTINRLGISVLILILILCLSLTNASPVLADEGQPTEPPTAAETDTPVEEINEGQPTEPPTTDELDTPAIETQEEVLTQVPEGTDVVVLDANGEPVPLASQQAADIVAVEDPMWCPAGTLPGGTDCTTNYASIDLLVDELTGINKPDYMQNGIIYFTSGASGDSFILTNISIDATDFDSLNDYNLTLQGGWNGLDLGLADFSGQTDFGSNYIQIGTDANRWVGNLTLNNFTFNGVGGGKPASNAITIYTTTGSIALNNVDVVDQTNSTNTALLTSTSGNVTVDDSSFDGNTGNQSKGFVAVTGGNIVISDTVFQESRRTGDSTYDGASLTGSTVSLTNVTATNNDGNGINISGAGTVTLNNVIATLNGTDLSKGDNLGSGLKITGTGSTIVNVTGGTFSNNYRYGVELYNGTLYEFSSPTCSGNALASVSNPCYNVTALIPNTAPSLDLPGDQTQEATSGAGAVVIYAVSATDTEDNPDPTPSCSPASGSTFPIGTTSVDCSVTDLGGLTVNSSFSVTVQDTTAPAIDAHGDLSVETSNSGGLSINYLAPGTSDMVDGAGTATCSPASGSNFPVGNTVVTCNATDAKGNPAQTSFLVFVTLKSTTPGGLTTTVGSAIGGATFADLFIPVTGGNTFVLSCVAPGSFKIESQGNQIIFNNLCGLQAMVEGVEESALPGPLPKGASLIGGFTINILDDGTLVDPLPDESSLLIGFNIPADQQNANLAVYQWDGKEWVEVIAEKTADGFFNMNVAEGGTFIFVQK